MAGLAASLGLNPANRDGARSAGRAISRDTTISDRTSPRRSAKVAP